MPLSGRRLITLADGAGSESYTYNNMGWITNVSKTITGATGNPYNLVYGYNGLGQLSSLTYPSGRIVTQGFDPIGRLSSIASGATTYLSSPTYNAAGEVLGFSYGNGVAATFTYNARLQLASLRYVNGAQDLLNLAYNYGAQNNGQIKDIKYYTAPSVEDQTKSQNYEYDAWGRLRRAYTTNLTQPDTWRLEWDYDRFGNRRNQTLTGGQSSITQPQLTISETTNRITTAGYVYDAAGNLTNDSLHLYTYDAENRIKTVDGTAATYTYSGPMRVKKVQGSTTMVYIFSGSKVIAEYVNGGLSKEYVYSGSTLVATHEGTTLKYHHPDHLSTRVETDGTTAATLRTFGQFPFGEAWYETGTASKWKFTSYERDGESGLDQAMFRYVSSRLGRFITADPLAGNTRDPQSLNRYAHVRNDPNNLLDPLGLFYFWFCKMGPGVITPNFEPNSGDDEPSSFTVRSYDSCELLFFGPFGGDSGVDPLDQAKELAVKVLSGDNNCKKFFGENAATVLEKVKVEKEEGPSKAKKDPETGKITEPRAARTSQGTGENSTIYINQNGAFFRSRAFFEGSTDTHPLRFKGENEYGFGGDTLNARVGIILHEFAHNVDKIPSDAGNPSQSTKNNDTILKECEDSIKATTEQK